MHLVDTATELGEVTGGGRVEGSSSQGAAMKKQCLTVGLAVLCSAALATAQQSTKTTEGQKDTRNPTKVDTVIVTGCVGQSSNGQGYMLNEAIMAPRPVDNKA